VVATIWPGSKGYLARWLADPRHDRPEHGLDELLRTDQELLVGDVRASFGGLGSG